MSTPDTTALNVSPAAPSPTPHRWVSILGALGGALLGLGALALALGSLAVLADLGRTPTALIGLAAAVLTTLGGTLLGTAWLGHVLAGRGGVAPMFGAFIAAGALVGSQLIGRGPELLMAQGLILIGGLILCALAHFDQPRDRFPRGASAIRGGATLALLGLAITTMAYSRSIELPLALAMGLILVGFLGITVLGMGLAVGFASLGAARAPRGEAVRS